MPSLPRDVTALGAEDLAPSAPTPSRPARAAPRDFDFEYDDDGGGAGTSPRGTGADQALYGGMDSRNDERGPEYLDLDAAALEEARARAAEARARAEEARRAATRATATATTLTIRAKEMLDVVSVRAKAEAHSTRVEKRKTRVSSRARGAPQKPLASLSRESSGVRTPTRSERGGESGFASADADADASSPAVTRTRARGGGYADAGDSTDMEESDATAPAPGSARGGKRPRQASAVVWAPKATDNIITADGQRVRRGCLNCGCQKTPQWRMGPTGPKTLCNACGVRFRKGAPMHE